MLYACIYTYSTLNALNAVQVKYVSKTEAFIHEDMRPSAHVLIKDILLHSMPSEMFAGSFP